MDKKVKVVNEVTVSKFEAKLSASDKTIKRDRAAIIAKSSRRSAENKVRAVEDEINALEITILNLTDLAPDTTYSLRPGGNDFKSDEWFDKLYEATLDLELKTVELDVAKRLLDEWF